MVELDHLCLEYLTRGIMKLRDHFNHADRKITPKNLRRLLRKMGIMRSNENPISRGEMGNTACLPICLEDSLLAGQIKFALPI